MKKRTIATSVLALGSVISLVASAFADENPYPGPYDYLQMDGSGYFVTDYVPHLRRTIVEVKAAVPSAADAMLFCANDYTVGGTLPKKASAYAYGNYFQVGFTGDEDWFDVTIDCKSEEQSDGNRCLQQDPNSRDPHVVWMCNGVLRVDDKVTYCGYPAEGTESGFREDESGTVIPAVIPDESAKGYLYLGAWVYGSDKNGNRQIGSRKRIKLYYAKIWEISADNTATNLVRNYIPAKRSSDRANLLYDTVGAKYLAPTAATGLKLSPAPVAERYWAGTSGADTKWSTAGNWDDATCPTTWEGAVFTNARSVVEIDVDGTSASNPLVQDFYAVGSTVLKGGKTFYANVSGDGAFSVNNVITRGVLEASGAGTKAYFKCKGGRCAMGAGSGLKASDGGLLNVETVDFSDNANFTLTATNSGSKVVFTTKTSGANLDTANKGLVFAAYDGGSVESTSAPRFYKLDPKFIADGGTLSLGSFYMNQTGFTVTSRNGGTVKLGAVDNRHAAATISCSDTSVFNCTSTFYLPYSSQNLKPTLSLSGANPKVKIAGNATLGRNDSNAKSYFLTMNLTPELSWMANGPRIEMGSGKTLAIYKGVKYNVDVTAFTNYYGKAGLLLSQTSAGDKFTYVAPPDGWVAKTGAGSANCKVELVRANGTGKSFYVEVTSTNAVPPASSVAAVNNVGEATVFYDSLEAAVAAAKDGATVVVVRKTQCGKLAVAGKTITLSALSPVTIRGSVDTTNITVGENVTVRPLGLSLSIM